MTELVAVAGPLEMYWAEVGTAFPAIGTAPGTGWTEIGTSGPRNFTEDLVTVSMNQTIETFRGGDTTPLKAFRTEEDLVVTVTMADISLAQIRLALNLNAVNTGTGEDDISLVRGVDVATLALLVRGVGKSPEFDGANMQFELHKVYEGASQEMQFAKGGPAGVALEFHALKDDAGNVATLRAATA